MSTITTKAGTQIYYKDLATTAGYVRREPLGERRTF